MRGSPGHLPALRGHLADGAGQVKVAGVLCPSLALSLSFSVSLTRPPAKEALNSQPRIPNAHRQAAKDARSIMDHSETLRVKEEKRSLEVQEEKTKMEAALLNSQVVEFRASSGCAFRTADYEKSS